MEQHNEREVEKLFYVRQIPSAVATVCFTQCEFVCEQINAQAIYLAKNHQLSDERLGDAQKLIALCEALPRTNIENPLDHEVKDHREVCDPSNSELY